jgi:hypothetical protein
MGDEYLIELNQLVSKWRQWINCNNTFSNEELGELEDHLLEEIEDLQKTEELSEEEAFQKVVKAIGGRRVLDNEYNKTKPFLSLFIHWIKTNPWKIMVYICLFIFIFGFVIGNYPAYIDKNNKKNQLGYVVKYKGSYVPFKVINNKPFEGIKNPKIAWKRKLDNIQKIDYLIEDNENNIYINSIKNNKQSLYSLFSDGIINWKKELINVDNILSTNNGVIISSHLEKNESKLIYYDKFSRFKWSVPGINPTISPIGFLQAFMPLDRKLISYDSNGKTRWSFKIPEKESKNIDLKSYFYDSLSNVYLLVIYNDKLLVLYSVSSNGSFFSERDLYYAEENWCSNENVFINYGKIMTKDEFFILKNKKINNNLYGEIISYNLKGFEKWRFSLLSENNFDKNYIIDSESDFQLEHYNKGYYGIMYFKPLFLKKFIDTINTKPMNYKTQNDLLHMFDEDSKYVDYKIGIVINDDTTKPTIKSTELIIDKQNNTYSIENKDQRIILYSNELLSKERWNIELSKSINNSSNKLTSSINNRLFYFDNTTSTLYCIQDEGK